MVETGAVEYGGWHYRPTGTFASLAVGPATDDGHAYPLRIGGHPEIMYSFIPSQASFIDPDTIAPGTIAPVEMRSHDLRALGLEVASDRLRMRVADMEVVHVARAKADIRLCPVCPIPHAV